MAAELIADYHCQTGEGPLWHPQEKRLYWTDIPAGRMFRYDPQSGQHEQFYSGRPVGGFTIQADGALLLFMDRGTVALWRDGALEYIVEEMADEVESRFNDVIADPAGRVFCGTMPTAERPGRLYRLDVDGRPTCILEGIGCSNGLGFTPDRRHMYYTDTGQRKIYRFAYDESNGALSEQTVFVDSMHETGAPDGLTVDTEGFVWSAQWGGHCLIRYSPEGEEDRRTHFPALKVSSATFAGAHYADLYATTAGGNNKEENGQGAGALFRVDAGVGGTAEFPSRIGLG
ncbi:MAG: SMP-30/gluconolactonase/LRE family protein [Candidatus Latescibacteria bacterium]|nr:SMP-30/gluconolactonase/LRE family protein [Candidatus Latescibacterota bacterium]